jgi:hypothetical protein
MESLSLSLSDKKNAKNRFAILKNDNVIIQNPPERVGLSTIVIFLVTLSLSLFCRLSFFLILWILVGKFLSYDTIIRVKDEDENPMEEEPPKRKCNAIDQPNMLSPNICSGGSKNRTKGVEYSTRIHR